MKILNIIRSVTESYFVVIGLALFIGVVYAESVICLSDYSVFFLATIFFLSALKIDLNKVKSH